MSIPDFSLKGKVAIVTGGKRGIGRAIALAFAEAGADVAICSRGVEDGELEADVDNLVQKVMEQFGTIDILVNNAGILIRAPLLDMPEEDWDKIFAVDLRGYFLCALAAGRVMVERRKGNIINISTQQAFKAAMIELGAYGIAKAGVVMLTRVLARELGSYGIRANSIAPGLARTEFSRPTWGNPEVLKKIEASLPLGRIAEPDDFVGAALFLASDASSYVTGHTILMEGGGLA